MDFIYKDNIDIKDTNVKDSIKNIGNTNETDSISNLNNTITLLENGKIIADTLKKICSDTIDCKVKITYLKKNLLLADIKRLQNKTLKKDTLISVPVPTISDSSKGLRNTIKLDTIVKDSSKKRACR